MSQQFMACESVFLRQTSTLLVNIYALQSLREEASSARMYLVSIKADHTCSASRSSVTQARKTSQHNAQSSPLLKQFLWTMVCGDGFQSSLQTEYRIGYSQSMRRNLLNDKPTARRIRLTNKRGKMRLRIRGSMITKLPDIVTSNRSDKVSRNAMDAVESDKREGCEVWSSLIVVFSSSSLISSHNRIITPSPFFPFASFCNLLGYLAF